MQKKIYFLLALLLIVTYFSIAYSNTGALSQAGVDSKSRLEIINAIEKWTKDFNAKNIKDVCSLFAPDLVFSYQGIADKNYEDICRQLKTSLTDSDKKYFYESPKIEQVFVEGNLAVVNLVWTLKVSSNQAVEEATSIEKSLDVFRRQPDGSWKIVTFLAFTEKD